LVSLFKINDPYRLLLALILLVVFRLPFFVPGPVHTTPQLEWLVLGEKMSSGAHLYVDVLHPAGPITAGIYWIFNELFGRSLLPLHIAALILIFIQASALSFIMINFRSLNQNTYVPALIYVVLMSFFPDAAVLSPQLISITFIIMAINLVVNHISSRDKNDWVILYAGLCFGLATLSYAQSALFVVSALITMLLFTSTTPRRYILMIYGFFVPLTIVWIYYFWKNEAGMLFVNFFYSFSYRSGYGDFNYGSLMLLISGPLIFLVWALFKIITSATLTNVQVTQQNFMFILLVTGLVIISLDYYDAPFSLIILFIPMSFFIAQLFLSFKRKWFTEILFLIFLLLTLGNGYGSYFGIIKPTEAVSALKIIPQKMPYDEIVSGKKVLWVGIHPEIYRHARLATPYLSWPVSQRFLEHSDNPDILIRITRQMLNDLPDVIIDDHLLIRKIFTLAPVLAEKYKQEGQSGIYYRVEK
jgi:hypothetical protein